MSNSTGGSLATALLETAQLDSVAVLAEHAVDVTVPDSPAGLWVSASKPVTATGDRTWKHVSADTASWVAPPVTICAT